MSFRQIRYNIDFYHILTFREEYKYIIAPYFGFETVRYGIEDENTIDEKIKLFFETEKIALSIRKEGMTVVYEGDSTDITNPNGVLKIFWDIYEKIQKMEGYSKTSRHTFTGFDIALHEPSIIDETLGNPKNLFVINPFGKLSELACSYEFEKDDLYVKFIFGNYSKKDIKSNELFPFKTEFNKECFDGVGYMSRVEVSRSEKNVNFSKFKHLVSQSEKHVNSFNSLVYGE